MSGTNSKGAKAAAILELEGKDLKLKKYVPLRKVQLNAALMGVQSER